MNDEERNKFYETLESVAICQAMEMLIKAAEGSQNDDPAHMAMIAFFRSLLTKHRRRAGSVRIKTDDYGTVKIIDNELRTFNNN